MESVLFLRTAHISDLPSGKCSIFAHSTHFNSTVWKVFCFCAQNTFHMYRLESILFLCTIHIFDVTSGKCSVSVQSRHFCLPSGKYSLFAQSTHFCCTVWRLFCFCAQYTFLLYRLEIVLFLCTVHISAVPT